MRAAHCFPAPPILRNAQTTRRSPAVDRATLPCHLKTERLFRGDRTIERTFLALEIVLEVVNAFAGQLIEADCRDHSMGGAAGNPNAEKAHSASRNATRALCAAARSSMVALSSFRRAVICRWHCQLNVPASKASLTPFPRSHGRDRMPPLVRRLGSEDPERRARDEMALKVKGIVDGGMHAEKTLGRARRLEALHFVLSSSHRLMRIFGLVVLPEPLYVRTD